MFNPFFLIPAVTSFLKSILALILFGLAVQLIGLLDADAADRAFPAGCPLPARCLLVGCPRLSGG